MGVQRSKEYATESPERMRRSFCRIHVAVQRSKEDATQSPERMCRSASAGSAGSNSDHVAILIRPEILRLRLDLSDLFQYLLLLRAELLEMDT
jgi:hypothetical protein